MTSSRPLLGIFYMCLATSLFPVMNGLVQVLSARYSSEQIVWARMTSHLIFVLVLFMPRAGWRLLWSNLIGWQIARSLAQLGSTTMYFFSVKHLGLAQATSISFTTPFFVAMLAWPMLGERMTAARLGAMLACFTGVLIVVRPGTAVFHWAAVGIIASTVCYALYQILTRKVAGTDKPETSVVYSALGGAVLMGIVMLFRWKAPESLTDAVLLFGTGILGGIGHYFVAQAMTCAPASVVSPFMYWQMIGSVIVGYLFSGTLPDAFTWIGSAIIICAGLYLGWVETREKKGIALVSTRPDGGR